jgi:hypothetical protein
MLTRLRFGLLVCFLLCAPLLVRSGPTAGVILFDQKTDTISVAGQIVLADRATYEARVLFTSTAAGGGLVINEWKEGLEDKFLGVDVNQLNAYSFGLSETPLLAPASLSLNAWHHVAYVYDGLEERLYLDGTQIGLPRQATGTIANSDGLAFVGAIFRDGSISPGMVGYLDTLRISDVARYSGSSFTSPQGDLSGDSHTLLLYNFNESSGSSTVADLSGNGHTGTLGSGFEGATAPTLVTDPLHLSGTGTATIDGVMSPAEWDRAATFNFHVNLPSSEGGGTTPATLLVMSDATNLYLAVKVARPSLDDSSYPTYIGSGVVFDFDNNHDGIWPENGDDALVLNAATGTGFFDDVRTNQLPPCDPDSPAAWCGVEDTDLGGTIDGHGAVKNDGQYSFYEISHPLDSGDVGHDFALAPGSTVGFSLKFRFCDTGCVDTAIPAAGFGDIRIALTSDRDGDGIPDALDACPDVPGDAAHSGCPPPPSLSCPPTTTIKSCSLTAIGPLPYSTTPVSISLAQLAAAGGSASAEGGIASITYQDRTSGSCPNLVVTRTFTVTDGCGQSTSSQQIIRLARAPDPQVDLAVLELAYSAFDVLPGGGPILRYEVLPKARIANLGRVNASNVDVTFDFPQHARVTVKQLDAGSSIWVVPPRDLSGHGGTAFPGQYTLTVKVDSGDRIPETDESNNAKTTRVILR